MKSFYEQSSSMNFNKLEKIEEFDDLDSRFIITYDETGVEPLGFTMFRFDMEETMSERDAQVIYWFVVIFHPSLRRFQSLI